MFQKLKFLLEKEIKYTDFDKLNFHLGTIPSEQHNKLLELNPHSTNISNDHKKHLFNYTHDSAILNKKLFNKEDLHDNHKEQVKHLDNLTRKPTSTEHHLFTGTKANWDHLLKQSKDNIVHLSAYTSTSINSRKASFFGNGDMLHIHVKPGDKMHHVHPDHAKFEDERETILPRNTKLKVNPIPDEHVNLVGDKRRIFHATIHSQDEE